LHGIKFLAVRVVELRIRQRRQSLQFAMRVHAPARVLFIRAHGRPPLIVGRRSSRRLIRPAHVAFHAIGRRAALEPQLNRLHAQLLVVIAHELFEQSVRFLAGFVKTALLNLAVERVPFAAKAAGPLLAGAWLAMDALGDGLPGMPNRSHLGGDG
jgi:hypothetical protein